ncbi:DUF1697 domain-containing protein [Cognatishimia sp. SS12]|uniref:DUF1697 domain-containing protein n=1 Tax=Cognatishimia sp. SS12 TaxID=2979465 RepID=UPI0023301B8C|nr:DUF1697 domain-containing protein [Cognatishimia sp. SS12]MDC0736906.1 DUF1697 domain-containing protein [Cognatishimia sp. SS12]
MARWIILLRGVNVGGHGKLPMAALRQHLANAGYSGVKTYIQSGNIVLDSTQERDALCRQIADLIERHFGFCPPALALRPDELRTALAEAPFEVADKKQLHLYFLGGTIALDAEGLRADCTSGEVFERRGHVLYLATPNGMGRSRAAAKLETHLKVDVITARNLNSCEKLLALAGD